MLRQVCLAILLQAGCCLALAGDRVVLMIGGIEKIIYLPVALADGLGYFRDAGVDVELRSRAAGVEAEDELLTGAVQGVVGFYDHVIDLQAKGKAVQSVVQLGIAPGQAVVTRANTTETRSLAPGARFGVTGLGSSTHFLGQYLAAREGIAPRDVTFVPVQSGHEFIRALAEGRIDIGMTSEPTVSRLVASGSAVIVADLRTPAHATPMLGGVYPAACLYMQASWVRQHRDKVHRIVAALVKALQYIATHTAEEVAAHVPPPFYAGNRAIYVKALEESMPMFSRDGLMPEGGPRTALRVLSAIHRRLRGKPIDLSRTYTTEFLPGDAR